MPSLLPPGVLPSSPLGKLLAQVRELIDGEHYAEAIAPMIEAANLAPDNARILTDLGGLYVELGQPAKALAPLRSAISLRPKVAIAHWRLGTALQALGDTGGALRSLEKAVEIRPDLADAHLQLALLYREQGRGRDALASYRKAAALADEPADQLFLQAQIYRMEGRDAKAESLLRSALELEPDLILAHGILAQILAESGRHDEAAQHYEAQLVRTPRAGMCYYDLVRSRKIMVADKDLLQRMDTALKDESLDDINRSVLLLARSKALDDLGRYDEAMKSMDTASELRARAFSLQIEDFEKQVDKIIALFNAETIAKLTISNTDRMPVLIAGMPRSGTTLVEQIVSSHSVVVGAGELIFWRKQLQATLRGDAGALNGDFLAAAAAEYLNALRNIGPSAARVTDKDPFNFLAIGLIHMALPQAAIIHCRRNPVDNAISIHQTHFSKSTGIPTGGEDLVRYFRGYQRLMAHWRQVLPAGRMLELDYENLTASPKSEIRRLIDYIGLPWDDVFLTPHVNIRLVKTPSGWQVRQSINTDSVDRWRRYEPWLGPLAALLEKPLSHG